MKKLIFLSVAAVIMTTVACNKFLDVTPKGKVILSTVTDYDQWLNSRDLTASGSQDMSLLNDITDMPYLTKTDVSSDDKYIRIYLWATDFNIGKNTEASPAFWGTHYANIYRYNAVMNGIDDASGSAEMKKQLKAEAMLGRAFEYFYLVNLFAKPYDSTTASADLAIPIIESNDISKSTPPRSTVQEVYDYIFDNINKALPDLPESNKTDRFRGSKAAAHSVLARIYFYMGKYPQAKKEALLALEHSHTGVLDYNTIEDFNKVAGIDVSDYDIYSRYGTSAADDPSVTLSYINSMSRHDRRYVLFYSDYEDYEPVSKDSAEYTVRGNIHYSPSGNGETAESRFTTNFGTTAVEMKFIVAEADARSGNLAEALDILNNDIRKNRYETDYYTPYESNNPDSVLDKILAERKFEFPFCSLRWLDMRRLDTEGKMGPITQYYADGMPIGTLEPHDPRYVLKIPTIVLRFNPDMPQNP